MLSERQNLKIELLSEGIRVSENAHTAIEGAGHRPLTTGDYATTNGIILNLGEHIFVNAPFHDENPNFVGEAPPHLLDFSDGKFWVISGAHTVEAEYVAVPGYIDKTLPDGERYIDLVATHTDRARISPIQGCAIACQFCNLPYDYVYNKKTKEDLIDSIRVALEDTVSPAQHLLISGGTPRPEDYGYENDAYAAAVENFPGLEVDVMMVPAVSPDGVELLNPEKLKEMGIHELSINLELYNRDIAKKITSGKYRLGLDHYLAFMERAVKVFGVAGVRSILIVGLEPMEDTLKAVQLLAERGVSPELSPLRPDPSTPLKDTPPPSAEMQKELYQRARDIVLKYPGVYMGLRCIPCMHNVLNFPDMDGYYYPHFDREAKKTTYERLRPAV
jgi:hypothetical protein